MPQARASWSGRRTVREFRPIVLQSEHAAELPVPFARAALGIDFVQMSFPDLSNRRVSIAPDGSKHAIPTDPEAAASFADIEEAARAHRLRGGQVVVIQGLGFVGAAVCAAVAGASDSDGNPSHYVIGVDLPTAESYWKVAKLNSGLFPF